MAIRTVSEGTQALLDQLLTKRSRFRRSAPDVPSLLSQVGASGEPAAVPSIVSFLIDGPDESRRKAAEAVARLVALVGPRDVLWFDNVVRRRGFRWPSYPSPWQQLTPLSLRKLVHQREAVLCVAASHPNGYVRQAALDDLKRLAVQGHSLPFLLLRLNDWVDEVRRSAEDVLRHHLAQLQAEDLLPALALLPWLQHGGLRADLSDIADAILGPLREPSASHAREQARWSRDVLIRRAGFRVSAEVEWSEALFRAGIHDPDPTLAREMLSSSLTQARKRRAEVALTALTSPHAPVRSRALWELISNYPEHASSVRAPLLFDGSSAVRELARRAGPLMPHESVMRLGLEEATASSGRGRAAALLGLAELGLDHVEVRRVLNIAAADSSPRLRAAALVAASILDGGIAPEQALAALEDPSPRVSWTAYQLASHDRVVPATAAWRLALGATAEHTRRHAFLLAVNQPKWTSLAYILSGHALVSQPLRRQARIALKRWLSRFNESSRPPSEPEMVSIRHALSEHGHLLDPTVLKKVQFFTS